MSVESALSQLNVPIRKKLSHNRIMTNCFINSMHEDSDPSCVVWLDSGVIYCHGCKESTNVIKVFQKRFNVTYQEAENQIFGYNTNVGISSLNQKFNDNLKAEKEEKQKNFISYLDHLYLVDMKDSSYALSRGWDGSFIDNFNVKLCLSDQYMDYAIIPIVSEKLGIHTFEARKIFQLEYLQKLFKTKCEDLNRLALKFKQNKKMYEYHIYYEYLTKPKTLYEYSAPVDKLIFNYDNLDFNEPLIIVEGLASIPKIWNGVTKNVTSCFGSKFSDTQIKLLRQFKDKIIVVSDNDLASYLYINKLDLFLDNVYAFDCYTDDTDSDFVSKLKSCDILKANDFLMKREMKVILERLENKHTFL